MKASGLQRNVRSGTSGAVASGCQRSGLGVPFTGLDMITLTNDFTLADQDTTHDGIGMR